ncbi:hypothetical protein D3C75_1074120 [compost metagenome]
MGEQIHCSEGSVDFGKLHDPFHCPVVLVIFPKPDPEVFLIGPETGDLPGVSGEPVQIAVPVGAPVGVPVYSFSAERRQRLRAGILPVRIG